MKRNKVILVFGTLLVLVIAVSGFILMNRIQTKVRELFRLNKVLQEEGYYMADFEFKMLGFSYYLDKGKYDKALRSLSLYHEQLDKRANLIRIPEFKNKAEELEFYLNLQNPRTGAFMDDSFPYCTFNEPTENILMHIDALAQETGTPMHLKYPLKYLDSINTPEKLYPFLEDVSNVGWIGSKFPQTSYVFARSLLSYWNDEGVIGRNKLYSFSPEYKDALLKWFYNNQDSITGYWGPRSVKNGRLLKPDLTNTASVIKTFVDKDGNNIHQELPLRYGDKLIGSTLKLLSGPVPDDDDLVELHEWNLAMSKGLKMLLRYVWKDASEEDKKRAKEIIENFIRIRFDKYYVPEEGAFSYYPGAEHASLDGTGGFIYNDIGAYSPDKQKTLWGGPSKNIIDLGEYKKTHISSEDFNLIAGYPEVNSLRIYLSIPDYNDLTQGVYAITYPSSTSVPEMMELVPGICKWLDNQSLSMGNWSSQEEIKGEYESLKIKMPVIFKESFPADSLNKILLQNHELKIIGFDLLQIPRYKICFTEQGK